MEWWWFTEAWVGDTFPLDTTEILCDASFGNFNHELEEGEDYWWWVKWLNIFYIFMWFQVENFSWNKQIQKGYKKDSTVITI